MNRSFNQHKDTADHLKCTLMLKKYEKDLLKRSSSPVKNSRIFIVKYNEDFQLNRCFLKLIIHAIVLSTKYKLLFGNVVNSNNSIPSVSFEELLFLLVSNASLEIQTIIQE